MAVEEFDRAKELVEATIGRLGVDPAASRAKETPNSASWAFQRGSAAVLVSLTHRKEDEVLYIRAISPLMTLPDPDGTSEALPRRGQHQGTREALFVRLLELNGRGLANCAFGLIGDRVVLVSERPVRGLDGQEAEQLIRHLATVADTYDDKLVKEFGGTRVMGENGTRGDA